MSHVRGPGGRQGAGVPAAASRSPTTWTRPSAAWASSDATRGSLTAKARPRTGSTRSGRSPRGRRRRAAPGRVQPHRGPGRRRVQPRPGTRAASLADAIRAAKQRGIRVIAVDGRLADIGDGLNGSGDNGKGYKDDPLHDPNQAMTPVTSATNGKLFRGIDPAGRSPTTIATAASPTCPPPWATGSWTARRRSRSPRAPPTRTVTSGQDATFKETVAVDGNALQGDHRTDVHRAVRASAPRTPSSRWSGRATTASRGCGRASPSPSRTSPRPSSPSTTGARWPGGTSRAHASTSPLACRRGRDRRPGAGDLRPAVRHGLPGRGDDRRLHAAGPRATPAAPRRSPSPGPQEPPAPPPPPSADVAVAVAVTPTPGYTGTHVTVRYTVTNAGPGHRHRHRRLRRRTPGGGARHARRAPAVRVHPAEPGARWPHGGSPPRSRPGPRLRRPGAERHAAQRRRRRAAGSEHRRQHRDSAGHRAATAAHRARRPRSRPPDRSCRCTARTPPARR
ncbi:hypothetical protein ACU686_25890 [Yinghuangia aomiensis]